jgi:hypothetical protein
MCGSRRQGPPPTPTRRARGNHPDVWRTRNRPWAAPSAHPSGDDRRLRPPAQIARYALASPQRRRAPERRLDDSAAIASLTAGRVARAAPLSQPRSLPVGRRRRVNQHESSESTTGCQRKRRSSLAVAAVGLVRIVKPGPDEGVILTLLGAGPRRGVKGRCEPPLRSGSRCAPVLAARCAPLTLPLTRPRAGHEVKVEP